MNNSIIIWNVDYIGNLFFLQHCAIPSQGNDYQSCKSCKHFKSYESATSNTWCTYMYDCYAKGFDYNDEWMLWKRWTCTSKAAPVQLRCRKHGCEPVQFRAHFFNILGIFDSYFTLSLIDQRLRPIWSEERWNKTISSFLGDSSVYARASWEVRCSLEAWRGGDHHDHYD